jgi:hypothetical protein
VWSVVAVVFQSVFILNYIKIMFFYFLKIIFKIAHQNDPKHKKNYFLAKKIEFFENTGLPAFPDAVGNSDIEPVWKCRSTRVFKKFNFFLFC